MTLSDDLQTIIDGIDRSINGSPYRQTFIWVKEQVEWIEQKNKLNQERFDAWKEGSIARLKGLKLHECPYKSRTRRADSWENGWEVTDLNLNDVHITQQKFLKDE